MKAWICFLSCLCLGASLMAGESYNILMLSDFHWGEASAYDVSPGAKFRTKKDIRLADRMEKPIGELLADAAANCDPDTRLMVECGDLVEGGLKGEAVHAEQLKRSLDRIKRYISVPMYPVNGNHDDWGNGGPEAFKKVILPFIARELHGRAPAPVFATNYSFTEGGDLYVFLDTYTVGKQNDWQGFLRNILTAKPKYRYLFVVLHNNVMPFVNSTWLELAEMLSGTNAIILCGHSHRNILMRYDGPWGKMAQISVGSCVSSATSRMALGNTDLEKFWAWWTPNYAKSKDNKARLQKFYIPYLKEVYELNGYGYAKFLISDGGVLVEFHGKDSKVTKPVVLKVR